MFDFQKLLEHYKDHRETYKLDDILFVLKHARKQMAYCPKVIEKKHELLTIIEFDLLKKHNLPISVADKMLFEIPKTSNREIIEIKKADNDIEVLKSIDFSELQFIQKIKISN